MSIPLDTLQSPADADNFRMTVDYGRWYIDPLDGCDIAPASEWKGPSFSEVKKASEKDWSFLVAPRLAALPKAELHRIADLDPTQRLDAIRAAEKHAKQIAFGRGTIIHLFAEDLAAGRPPREITNQWLVTHGYPEAARDDAAKYLDAMVDFFAVYQPEPIALEYVTIHRDLNEHGYGCTPDGLFRIMGKVAAVDWKTRSDGSKPAAYPEEAAQIAAGVGAQYMVVRDGGEARRQKIPHVDIGYVVSIHADGARLYPVDIPKAWDHFERLHQWWVHRRTEKDAIGRVLPKKVSDRKIEPGAPEQVIHSTPPALDRAALLARYSALDADDQERFKALGIDRSDLAAIAAALDTIEHPPRTIEHPPRTIDLARERMARENKPVAVDIDEGAPADEADIHTAQAMYEVGMTAEQKAWVDSIVHGATAAHRDIRVTAKATQRRADLCYAIAKYATSPHWDPDGDDGFRAAIYLTTGDPSAMWPTLTLGDAVGQMDAATARQLRDAVDAISQDLLVGTVGETGVFGWKPQPAA